MRRGIGSRTHDCFSPAHCSPLRTTNWHRRVGVYCRTQLHRFSEVVEKVSNTHQIVERPYTHIALCDASADAKSLLQEETGISTLIRMIAARLVVERFCLVNE